MTALRIAMFGSSLVSSYWNGAATYYRGIVSALAARGHCITFYEPDIYERQSHRDIPDPPWAEVKVYAGHDERAVQAALEDAIGADVVIKASGVGEFDELLECGILQTKSPEALSVFWDVDAPATLERVEANPTDPFRSLIPRYDLIFTYGGGDKVVRKYRSLGARQCEVIYNALDPQTHYRERKNDRFTAHLGLLANRLPDRESRIEEFFLRVAAHAPQFQFVLGGSGWDPKTLPRNVMFVNHVGTADHNAFNSTPLAILNVHRDSMIRFGFSPATRLFEAAGAGACLISDAWEGIETFLEPGREVLVARSGDEVLEHLLALTPERAQSIGQAACIRITREHTYAHRAAQIEQILNEAMLKPNAGERFAPLQAQG
jgi:spore maturation protein CgeB